MASRRLASKRRSGGGLPSDVAAIVKREVRSALEKVVELKQIAAYSTGALVGGSTDPTIGYWAGYNATQGVAEGDFVGNEIAIQSWANKFKFSTNSLAQNVPPQAPIIRMIVFEVPQGASMHNLSNILRNITSNQVALLSPIHYDALHQQQVTIVRDRLIHMHLTVASPAPVGPYWGCEPVTLEESFKPKTKVTAIRSGTDFSVADQINGMLGMFIFVDSPDFTVTAANYNVTNYHDE